jgi:hypothetical protein
MIYHELRRSGLKLSAIGFGTMRWTNEKECRETVHRGLDLGINYADTSTGYVGGKSHKWVANAIRDRRDEIYFSSKSHWASVPDADEVLRTIQGTLKTLDLEYLDLYQLWGLQSVQGVKDATKKGGFIEGVREAQQEGFVRHGVGFTFHGTDKAFKMAVNTGEFVSATVSYNLMKRDHGELIDYAGEHGVGVIIMNPLGGGVLAKADDRKLDFLRRRGTGPCYGALRFLLAHPHITTSIVGFSSPDQVDENLRALEQPERLTEEYRRTLAARMEDGAFTKGTFCTGCGYCRDCPHGFDPTRLMEWMRDHAMYAPDGTALGDWLAERYRGEGESAGEALARCVECGACEEKCPQHLPIVQEIRRAKAAAG